MTTNEIIGRTKSVCPQCLAVIDANKVAKKDGIYLVKQCPDHGMVEVLIWNGPKEEYLGWSRQEQQSQAHYCHTQVKEGCPYDCGLCSNHKQQICCVLLEVTQRCNLQCPTCFASSTTQGQDPSLEEIGYWYDELMKAGGPFNIQLSGGEPSLRNDLPEIIQLGKDKGFTFFQLNTNGLRIAQSLEFTKSLAEAGLNCVFLQFDGLTEQPYEVLRGKPLLETKLAAIDHCKAAGLAVILVPTIAVGVNEQEIGNILTFALEQMPVVRGVHFQPMSHFGRYSLAPQIKRFTMPDILRAIELQTDGVMKVADFLGGGAENSYCSFHGNFMLMPDQSIKAIKSDGQSCCTSSKQSREFVAKRWSTAPMEQQQSCCCSNENQQQQSLFDVFIQRIENYTLAVSGMLFQDAWNLDLERLQSCYLCEISPDHTIIPFCAYNLTDANGNTLHRGKKSCQN